MSDTGSLVELKPCPHCGGKAQCNWQSIGDLVLHFVQCVKCGATGGKSRDKKTSIELWSDRYELKKP